MSRQALQNEAGEGGDTFEANQKARKSKVCGWERGQCSDTNDYYNKQPVTFKKEIQP